MKRLSLCAENRYEWYKKMDDMTVVHISAGQKNEKEQACLQHIKKQKGLFSVY